MTFDKGARRRVLVIGADGLRPDLLDPSVMPNVAALAASGVRFPDHHAAYPSHTRVNMSSLTTGATPGRHGIVANTMLVPGATPDHVIDTSDYQHLDALDQHSGGRMLLVPSLGDVLAAHGVRLAVAGTGTGGSNLLWTRNDRSRLVNPNTAFGIADLYDLREKLGEIPANDTPHLARLDYATSAVIDIYLGDPDNRVIVLWLAEPDSSFHKCGLGSPEALAAMRGVDACVGRILDVLDRAAIRDQFDILFMSDHGHSTVQAHKTLREYLIDARAELGTSLPPLATASDFIYALPGTPEPEERQLAPLVEWLQSQEWCDIVFSGPREWISLPGTLPLSALWNGVSNERRPLLAVSPAWSDARNEFGVPGTVSALTTQAALRSSHGSASPYDMHATLIASGPSFREGVVSTIPTGTIDIAPTILSLLGLRAPTPVDGRVLREGLVGQPEGEIPDLHDEIIEPVVAGAQGHRPRLRLHHVGATSYVHGSEA